MTDGIRRCYMKIIADLTNLSNGTLIADGIRIPISCIVRTVKDGTRGKAEVKHCIPAGYPYDPRPFPKGIWKITAVEWQKDWGFDRREYGTVKIRTNAWQFVEVWKLDKDGDYLQPTETEVKDSGYLIHYSESRTTLGCIKVLSQSEAEILAKFVEKQFAAGEAVELEVL
jgi:hypothetical protein